jgi:hypothetical protein
MTLLRNLQREEGELGIVSALLLLGGVLLPIMFIVVAFARIESGRLAAARRRSTNRKRRPTSSH